jgi:hypothetical protein
MLLRKFPFRSPSPAIHLRTKGAPSVVSLKTVDLDFRLSPVDNQACGSSSFVERRSLTAIVHIAQALFLPTCGPQAPSPAITPQASDISVHAEEPISFRIWACLPMTAMSAITRAITAIKFAAPQHVILKERPPLPRMKDLNRAQPTFAALCLCSHPKYSTPTPIFWLFAANKGTSTNPRLGLAWVTLGPRLGGPCVAQGPPNPKPNPKIGRGSQTPQKTQNATVPRCGPF